MITIAVATGPSFVGSPKHLEQAAELLTKTILNKWINLGKRQIVVTSSAPVRAGEIGVVQALILIAAESYADMTDDERLAIQTSIYQNLQQVYPDLQFSVKLSLDLSVDRFKPHPQVQNPKTDDYNGDLRRAVLDLRVERAVLGLVEDNDPTLFRKLERSERARVHRAVDARPDRARFKELLLDPSYARSASGGIL